MVKRINENKMLQEAESYKWIVESYEAHEAYNMACDYFGKEYVNDQIVDTLSDDELASSLAFLFRMWDFRQWDERDNVEDSLEDEEFDDNDFDESIKRNKRRMKEGLPVYLKGDNDDKSRFLSRFISDVKYWISLGKTPEADKFLWAGTPEEQAQVIQDTFDAITDQADRVLTQDDIDYYLGELLNRYNESVRRGSRKRKMKEAKIGKTKVLRVLPNGYEAEEDTPDDMMAIVRYYEKKGYDVIPNEFMPENTIEVNHKIKAVIYSYR